VSNVSETDGLERDGTIRQHASPQSTADMLASPEEKDILKGTVFFEKDPLRPNGGGERYPPIVAAIPMESLRHTAEA
jgi:hypothetical protein